MTIIDVKYTLDKIEDGHYVFLENFNEENQLIIPENKVTAEISEGSIVLISSAGLGYEFEVLEEETEITRDKVTSLLEKLKNKNK